MDSRELPQYECHKKVWALKIKAIEPKIDSSKYGLEAIIHNGATITPAEEGYAPFEVHQGYIDKHSPKVGGYYVVYADGYKSFSPAEAFESGYTLINREQPKGDTR
ncbi:hypothetical protein DF052_00355 [Burkholderia glumae]|uniref:hypothetical protein n=1 Tax=Burkholderia glumae TaxID=337 RepID=UPI000F5E11B8|nr:hypothetical protein [Burkholderia glumae]RQZ76440.1 hypothetical protein DF052_00355 [Burkholderia glumae]